jgi:hypothetical protein
MIITVALTPKGSAALNNLRTAPERLMPALLRGIDGALEEGMTQTLKTRFTGKRPPASENRIGVVTGRLRSSFQRRPAQASGGIITASIGSAVKYWMPHERGFNGRVAVAAHMRRTSRTVKFLGDFQKLRMRNGRLVNVTNRRTVKQKIQGKDAFVSAHSRNVNIPARRMMYTGLTEQAGRMGKIISFAVISEWKKGAA